MEVNEIQIGGKHYKREYQHWDLVCDLELHYLLGCSTKYVSRWQEKNGLEDLRKSLHYIAKFEDKGLLVEEYTHEQSNNLDMFCDQLHHVDGIIVKLICLGSFEEAVKLINELIEEVESGPTSNYVDPDNNYIRG